MKEGKVLWESVPSALWAASSKTSQPRAQLQALFLEHIKRTRTLLTAGAGVQDSGHKLAPDLASLRTHCLSHLRPRDAAYNSPWETSGSSWSALSRPVLSVSGLSVDFGGERLSPCDQSAELASEKLATGRCSDYHWCSFASVFLLFELAPFLKMYNYQGPLKSQLNLVL